MIFLITIQICFILLISEASVYAAPPININVLVIESAPSVDIRTKSAKLKISTSENKRKLDLTIQHAIISADKSGLLITSKKPTGKRISIDNRAHMYLIGNRSFYGKLSVIWKSPNRLMVVDTLPLERYLVGIVGSEISSKWPMESIKSQVVAARTYALYHIEANRKYGVSAPFDIRSTTMSQVYNGAHLEDAASFKAVKETRGEVLYRNGHPFQAYYHSCCGGRTEHAYNVWKNAEGGPIVMDKYCKNSPYFKWHYSISSSEMAKKFSAYGEKIGKIYSINTTSFSDSPRVQYMILNDETGIHMIKATSIRKIIGYRKIRSTWFKVTMKQNFVIFDGRGYGHGVGLCQWGSKGMAEAGYNYKSILKFYYPDSTLKKAY